MSTVRFLPRNSSLAVPSVKAMELLDCRFEMSGYTDWKVFSAIIHSCKQGQFHHYAEGSQHHVVQLNLNSLGSSLRPFWFKANDGLSLLYGLAGSCGFAFSLFCKMPFGAGFFEKGNLKGGMMDRYVILAMRNCCGVRCARDTVCFCQVDTMD